MDFEQISLKFHVFRDFDLPIIGRSKPQNSKFLFFSKSGEMSFEQISQKFRGFDLPINGSSKPRNTRNS